MHCRQRDKRGFSTNAVTNAWKKKPVAVSTSREGGGVVHLSSRIHATLLPPLSLRLKKLPRAAACGDCRWLIRILTAVEGMCPLLLFTVYDCHISYGCSDSCRTCIKQQGQCPGLFMPCSLCSPVACTLMETACPDGNSS